MNNPATTETRLLNWPKSLAWAVAAVAAFHVAYASSATSFCILLFLFSLFQLRRLSSSRKAFYFGLAIGFAIYAPQLNFFWKLFGLASIALWLVLAFWLGLFLLLSQLATNRFGEMKSTLLIPFLWTGLEYFRSELYYLRFSWLNAGYAFSDQPGIVSTLSGVYGVSFWSMAVFSILIILRHKKLFKPALAILAILTYTAMLYTPAASKGGPFRKIKVAGIQLEFPNSNEVVPALNKVLNVAPEAELLLLSEYTFDGPIPNEVRDWCRENQRWLIAGGKEMLGDTNFYNTAFVVSTNGEVVFRQHKSVPIQFFKDGLPAKEQNVWESPWGKIGIAICYDFSYTCVVDGLIRKGAQALIIPTMDVEDWGAHQHNLHARVAPVRAAEYGVPVFRVCSSGISQIVSKNGTVVASASFPGQGEIIPGDLVLRRKRSGPPHVPLDRLIAWTSVVTTAGFILWLCFDRLKKTKAKP